MILAGIGRSGKSGSSPMHARAAASTRSALTSLSTASAKRRARRGLALAIGRPAVLSAFEGRGGAQFHNASGYLIHRRGFHKSEICIFVSLLQ
jgi:hypothetical protein